jgi:hypothetical protein
MAIEVRSDGFFLTRSTSTGYISAPIGSAVPVAGQTYFLELIIRDGQGDGLNSVGYVFQNNGGSNDPPTRIGAANLSTGFSWTTPVYYGSGVSQGSTSPLSDYTVSEYRNHKMGYN